LRRWSKEWPHCSVPLCLHVEEENEIKKFKDVLCVATPGVELQPALERAVTLAENNQASLTVVDVIEPMTSTTAMPEGGPDFVDLQAAIVKAHEQELHSQIEADLVVMGTVARTGIPGFIIGNTAETILNQIDGSVLAIKPRGFVTPVTLEE
jgi:nucleotide-binding universal stress UspA family protein